MIYCLIIKHVLSLKFNRLFEVQSVHSLFFVISIFLKTFQKIPSDIREHPVAEEVAEKFGESA
jgi:hypothetical protein